MCLVKVVHHPRVEDATDLKSWWGQMPGHLEVPGRKHEICSDWKQKPTAYNAQYQNKWESTKLCEHGHDPWGFWLLYQHHCERLLSCRCHAIFSLAPIVHPFELSVFFTAGLAVPTQINTKLYSDWQIHIKQPPQFKHKLPFTMEYAGFKQVVKIVISKPSNWWYNTPCIL